MARYWFGGGVADWSLDTVTVSGTANLAQVAGGATMTFWTAETGGSQYIDLLDSDGVAVTVIESADGTVARAAGQIPPLQGPEEVQEMWASANDGPRALLVGRHPSGSETTAGAQAKADAAQAAAEAAAAAAYAPIADVLAPVANPRRWPQMTVLSNMSSGWTVGGALSSNLADTTDVVLGPSSVSMTTKTDSTVCYTQKTLAATDMTGKGLVVWVKLDSGSLTDTLQLIVDVASDTGDVNRYRAQHFLNNNKYPIKAGEWCPLQISNAHLRMDVAGTPNIAAIVFLRVGLYGASGKAVPWRVGGVSTYDDTSTKWPNGVVSLTFDDSSASTWPYAVPKMAARGWAGTLFPIHATIGTANCLTLTQIKRLQNIYGWEIGAHASSNANHVDYTAQTAEWIADELRTLRRWQRANGLPSSSFAWPSGTFSTDAAAAVSAYFASARSTADKVDPLAPIDPMGIGSVVCNATLTLAQAQARVDAAAAGKGWLRFTFHTLVTSAPTGNDWLISDFNTLMDYIASKGIPVVPIGNV